MYAFIYNDNEITRGYNIKLCEQWLHSLILKVGYFKSSTHDLPDYAINTTTNTYFEITLQDEHFHINVNHL